MNNKKTLIVTGAGGLIGNGLLDILKNNKKYRVIGVYKTNKPSIKGNNIVYLKGDLCLQIVWNELLKFSPDVLIHCAAKIPESLEGTQSKEARLFNLEMDKQAISYAKKKKVCFIYTSSSSVYGMIEDKIYNEKCKVKPIGYYVKGKIETEKNILKNKQYFKHFILRISAPYGPNQRYNNVLKIFIKNALRNKPLEYYGTGGRLQDFTYVKDVAAACLRALESKKCGIYNIASGTPISMKDLAHLIKRLTKSKSPVIPAGIGDPQENYKALFDISKAKKDLLWYPVYNIKKGLREFIKYIKDSEI